MELAELRRNGWWCFRGRCVVVVVVVEVEVEVEGLVR